MIAPFSARFPLRFAHCDPAGIGYYPRYLELCDAAIEDWTAAAIGLSRRAMHLDRGLGLPTVDLHAEFARVSRIGDLLDFRVSVARLGRSSIDLAVDVRCGSEPRLRIDLVQVLTRLDTMRAEPWPSEWRDRLMPSAEKEIIA